MKTSTVLAALLVCGCVQPAAHVVEPLATTTRPAAKGKIPPPEIVYLKAGRLFSAVDDVMRDHMAIVIEGDRIKAVAPESELPMPTGSRVVDLSHATVLPGLIDCHTHLAFRADRDDPILSFRDTINHAAFAAVKQAEKTLAAGFTTVRDLSSPPFVAVDLRDWINEGFLSGPRVVASGPMISQTGGHGDLNGYSPVFDETWTFRQERDFSIADGTDQVRHVVRAQLKHGVDVIKIAASGGVMSRGDNPGAAQFTVEEIRAAVEEAHAAGRKVAAHAHGTQAIKNAVIAGVDSIEHGSLIDEEGIRLMKQHGTWLVPDPYCDDFIVNQAKDFGLEQEHIDKERKIGDLMRANYVKAYNAGVKIAFGTDAGVYPHGDNARQFANYIQMGMTPAEAIHTATNNAAELLGRGADVGTIAQGRFADLIGVAKDPLGDVRVLEHVQVVIKGGKIVKDEISATSCAH